MLSSAYHFVLMGDACEWELGQQNPSVDTGAKDRRSLQLPEDVNGDGEVNIQDLVLVAGAFGEAPAAPAAYHLSTLTSKTVQQWLTEAEQMRFTDAVSRRGIAVLQQLLATLVPKETALLPNYPNPFNPETWIPYQLAKPAAVSLTIYTANGTRYSSTDLGVRASTCGHVSESEPRGILGWQKHAR